MRVILAKSAGFCYGVRRAVDLAYQAAGEGNCYMLGPVIHNDYVIAELAAQGMDCVTQVAELPLGSRVLLRSHGEGKDIYEQLAQRGHPVVDATCPNVAQIHAIVEAAGEGGRIPIVVGTKTHPEVTAIAAWHPKTVVVEGREELAHWLNAQAGRRVTPLSFVSQTTAIAAQWEDCIEFAKKECTNAEIFDTICNATCKRQTEALDLAGECDGMIVIGDPKSSNTKRLAELCRIRCSKVVAIQGVADLNPSQFMGTACVGITAGASTPGWIIKEVYDTMNDENKFEIEESFAEMLEKSIKTLHTGEKVTGVITGFSPTEVYVDLGTKHAGYIAFDELTDDPSAKMEDMVKVGDEIDTYVMRVNDQEGVVTLSKKRLDSVKSWDDIEAAVESHVILEGIVTEENKGGIVVSIRGVRVFVPASQTGLPREAEMSQIMKQKVRLRITEVNRARRRVVGSIRAVEKEVRDAKAGEVWSAIEVGKQYPGIVKSLTSYGAFVDIGGVDGMVHISELSWSRIKHPSEIVKTGDAVTVYILSFDAEKKKISLGMKDKGQDPWANFTSQYEIGSVVTARVVKLMTFGAFAEVVPGVDGLIHISQIADHRIEKPGDVLSEGQEITVRITEIDFENKKISLSIRALLEDVQAEEEAAAMAAAQEPDALVAICEEGNIEVAPSVEAAADSE